MRCWLVTSTSRHPAAAALPAGSQCSGAEVLLLPAEAGSFSMRYNAAS
jgi:hypothetical protein